RDAIRKEQKLTIVYGDEKGVETSRVVWPIGIACYEGRQTVAAWCELRTSFRHFRTDRIKAWRASGDRYPKREAALVKEWQAEMAREHARWEARQKEGGQGA